MSVGAVTCRHGTVRSRWQRLVDAGIPIDPISHSIHHISNDHLAGEASFADIADALLALLERAAERGHSDRDELLAELGTATTHRIKAGSRAKLPRCATTHEDLPPDHVEGHRDLLGARAGVRMLAVW